MIGGHSRNIGKTSVVEGIIRAFPGCDWTAVKITQFGHGVCSVNGETCGCSVAEHQFALTEEKQNDSGTDTSRFLAAGAKRSLWVRTKQGELFTALPSLKKSIEADDFVICESNSLRRFMKPDVYLQVLDPSNLDFKSSAQEFFDLADAYVVVQSGEPLQSDPWQNVSLKREIEKNKPLFIVSAEDRFLNEGLIEFVAQAASLRYDRIAK